MCNRIHSDWYTAISKEAKKDVSTIFRAVNNSTVFTNRMK